MQVKRLLVSSFFTNCYIYYNDKDAFIIDPGDSPKKIREFIEEKGLHVAAILITHGHIDHIGALQTIYETYHSDVYIHEEDAIFLDHPEYNLSAQFGHAIKVNVPVKYFPEEMVLAAQRIKIHHTPGHTPGSVMIEFIDDHVIFSGDTLFHGSIGRTDFPLSSNYDMKQSLRYISSLDYNAVVFPGHDTATSLQEEKECNPYLNR